MVDERTPPDSGQNADNLESAQPGQAPWYGPPTAEGYAPPSEPTASGPTASEPTWGGTTWGSATTAGWPPVDAPPDPGMQATRRPKPWKKVAGGVALAAVVAVGGVAAVTAANASSNSGSTQTAPGGPGSGGNGMTSNGYGPSGNGSGAGVPGVRGGVSALANALHGEFVVQTEDGGTQSQRLQRGEVTALSADSLLVTSSDGFSATYVVPAGLDVSSIAVGDSVRVIATVDGDTVTATSVQSGTLGAPGPDGQSRTGVAVPGEAGVPTDQGPTAAPTSVPSEAPVSPQTS